LHRLVWTELPLRDLPTLERTRATTVNDVMLAALAGGMRAYLTHDLQASWPMAR
jgi:hypothetical protein